MSAPGAGRPEEVVAVITLVRGRHDHLARQEASLLRQDRPADLRVVVSLGDPDLSGDHVVTVPVADGDPLPLARGRNAGAARALELGARVLTFLDVDCLAGPGTMGAYADAVRDEPGTVWGGPVTYLDEHARPYPVHDLAPLDRPHPARPAPSCGERRHDDRWELFWSLSFALSATAWERCGGFDEGYTGYGAEDTDFGQRARAAGLRLAWTGDARAYHQHHPTSTPPVQHLHDILRNGRTFSDRWGWWPMTGWLAAFEQQGLVRRVDDDWVLEEAR
ncbi:MAG: glycosyltransferase family 2 protein [Pseudorhodobacter sp.]|nr:glycosyltransferase family 2 protein [Frankiaceae bacterium]